MKILAPDFYNNFKCIAGDCIHSCCEGWEIDIDEVSLEKYRNFPEVFKHVSLEEVPHFELNGIRCPFLRDDNLCQLYIDHGEDFLCQICTDHPRFRNFWTGRIEVGLGLACEEAAKLVLGSDHPLKLEVIEDDGEDESLPEDETWLMDVRQKLLDSVEGNGPEARLLEYLIYRYVADALYDDCLEERIAFIQRCYDMVLDEWDKTDGSFESMVECARAFSVKYEYVENKF